MRRIFICQLVFCFHLSSAHVFDSNPAAVEKLIPAAPAENSPIDQADYKELLRRQNSRTENDCKNAGQYAHLDLNNFFGPAAHLLSADEIKRVSTLMEQVGSEAAYYTTILKDKWQRRRPFTEHSDIHPCITKPVNNPSYPSGHTSLSRVVALVLSEVFPARRASLLQKADEIAESRLIGGVHNPSDVAAGKKLADEIAKAILADASFKKEIEASKKAVEVLKK